MIFQMELFWSQKAYNWWVLGPILLNMKLAESTGDHQPIPGLDATEALPWLALGGPRKAVGFAPREQLALLVGPQKEI